jgi:hypothetical protein
MLLIMVGGVMDGGMYTSLNRSSTSSLLPATLKTSFETFSSSSSSEDELDELDVDEADEVDVVESTSSS